MNSVNLIGRLTRDPDIRYTKDQIAVVQFTIAIDRGNDKGADFPNIKVFGRAAENCEKYLYRGKQVGVTGRIHTGSYENRDGKKIYFTEVIADRVDFLGSREMDMEADTPPVENPQVEFQELNEDVPF